jgi:hypothetical protein
MISLHEHQLILKHNQVAESIPTRSPMQRLVAQSLMPKRLQGALQGSIAKCLPAYCHKPENKLPSA